LPSNSVLPRVNPWDVDPAAPAEQSGWANFDEFDSTLNIAEALRASNPTTTSQEATGTSPTSAGVDSAIPAVPVTEAAIPVESASENKIAPAIEALEKSVQELQVNSKEADSPEKVETPIPVVDQKSQKIVTQKPKVTNPETEQQTPKVEETEKFPTKVEETKEKSPIKVEETKTKSPMKVEETKEKLPIKIEESAASKSETIQETAAQYSDVLKSTISEASTKVEAAKKAEEKKAEVPKKAEDPPRTESTTKVDELEKQEKPLTML